MKTAKQQQGFTLTQTVITLAIVSVATTFGVLGIRTARAEFAHQSNARLFASYVEKARADAIRRHAGSGAESAIETFGPGTTAYAVTMDWGAGVVETRTFNLDAGLTFDTAARKVEFNWRGRISGAWVFQIKSQSLGVNLPVDVSGSGDITVGEQHFPDQSIPAVQISQVTGDVATPEPTPSIVVGDTPPADNIDPPVDGVSPTPTPASTPTPTPTPTPNGNGNGNGGTNGNGHGNSTPTPTPTPSGSPGATPIPQCLATLSPSTLYLSQSQTNNQSGTAMFTISNATGVRTISASNSGNGNSLVLGLSLQRIDGSGSSLISVTTKNGGGNRGVFVVDVSTDPSCGSTQHLTVSVSN